MHCFHCMRDLPDGPHKTIPGSRFPQSGALNNPVFRDYCKDCWVKLNGTRADCYACVRKKIRCPYHDYADDEEEGPYRRKEHDKTDD